jgi:hypothetical protein
VQEATEHERFDVLYQQLITLHSASIDTVFKATAALLIAAGWIVTSDTARRLLTSDPAVRWLTLILLSLYAALYLVAAISTSRRSERLAQQLKTLSYVPFEYYCDSVIHTWMVIMYIVMNSAICGALAAFAFRSHGQ